MRKKKKNRKIRARFRMSQRLAQTSGRDTVSGECVPGCDAEHPKAETDKSKYPYLDYLHEEHLEEDEFTPDPDRIEQLLEKYANWKPPQQRKE